MGCCALTTGYSAPRRFGQIRNWFSGGAISPGFSDDNTLFVLTGKTVFRSADGGRTMHPLAPKAHPRASAGMANFALTRTLALCAGGLRPPARRQPGSTYAFAGERYAGYAQNYLAGVRRTSTLTVCLSPESSCKVRPSCIANTASKVRGFRWGNSCYRFAPGAVRSPWMQ